MYVRIWLVYVIQYIFQNIYYFRQAQVFMYVRMYVCMYVCATLIEYK